MKKPPHETRECSEPHKAKKAKKTFCLETRYIGDSCTARATWRQWHTYWKKYATERDRQNACDGLNKGSCDHWQWEYRIPPGE